MADEPTTPETGAEQEPTTPPETPETPQQETTPGDLPDSVKEILAKERKAARDAEKARKQAEARIKEFEDRDKSESEKAAERAAEVERERDEALTKLSRFEVASEKGLPGELAEFLTGSKEEMAAKADVLLERLKTDSTPQVPGFDGGARDTPPPEKPADQAHNDLILGLTGHLTQNQ